MWKEPRIAQDLRDLGVTEGASVLVHTSLRAIGPMKEGAQTLVDAFRSVLGPTGTLMVPTFTFAHGDPALWEKPPQTVEALERARAAVLVFDPKHTPAYVPWMGVFPEAVRNQPDALRSDHPIVSFAAIGHNARFLTENAPLHYPLGSDSPVARLHQLDGMIVLLGVGHTVNTALHLAEIWANVPYIHRATMVKTGNQEWTRMEGSPECSAGFAKVEPLLRQARLLRHGTVGKARSQLMRIRLLVSMAVAFLQGESSALLCDRPDCPYCVVARRFTTRQEALPERNRNNF